MLITDHNVRETLRITDRAYIVTDGAIFRSGTPDEPGRPTKRCGGFISGPTSDWTKNPGADGSHGDRDVMAISQKLHTKLVQKLILTPSLQQAIKLLPMSTLELSDLLNQEMVENPMLEEVPTEELQPAEAQPPPRRSRAEKAAAEQDRHLGRRGLRVFLRRLPRRRLPSARAAGSQGAAADREHALDRAARSPIT